MDPNSDLSFSRIQQKGSADLKPRSNEVLALIQQILEEKYHILIISEILRISNRVYSVIEGS